MNASQFTRTPLLDGWLSSVLYRGAQVLGAAVRQGATAAAFEVYDGADDVPMQAELVVDPLQASLQACVTERRTGVLVCRSNAVMLQEPAPESGGAVCDLGRFNTRLLTEAAHQLALALAINQTWAEYCSGVSEEFRGGRIRAALWADPQAAEFSVRLFDASTGHLLCRSVPGVLDDLCDDGRPELGFDAWIDRPAANDATR